MQRELEKKLKDAGINGRTSLHKNFILRNNLLSDQQGLESNEQTVILDKQECPDSNSLQSVSVEDESNSESQIFD